MLDNGVRESRTGRRESQPIANVGLGARWNSPVFRVSCVLAVFAALFTNLAHLSVLSVNPDEPVYLLAGWRYLHGQSQVLRQLPNGSWVAPFSDNYEHPPLAKYLFGIAQSILGREDVAAGRVVAGLCTVLAGALLFWWLWRVVNCWVGLVAFAMVTLMPEHGLIADSFSRHAMLDPVAALFVVGSLIAGWYWFSSGISRGSWVLAMATGVLIGLAVSAKESGFVGMVGPILFGLAFASWQQRRLLIVRLTQTAVAAVVAVVVFLALYVPLASSPMSIVKYMIDYQSQQYSGGHDIELAGHAYAIAPWWATLWYADHGLGIILTVTLSVLALLAIGLRRDWLTGWLGAALIGPMIFLCFINTFALSFYWTLWTPAFYALAALGLGELVELCKTVDRRYAWAPSAAAIAALLVLFISFGQMVVGVETLKPAGSKVIAQAVERLGLGDTDGLLLSVPVIVMREYLPQRLLMTAIPKSLDRVKWIAEVPNYCPTNDVNTGLNALIDRNLARHHLVEAYQDSGIVLYRVTAPLQVPTPAEVAAIPPPNVRCPPG